MLAEPRTPGRSTTTCDGGQGRQTGTGHTPLVAGAGLLIVVATASLFVGVSAVSPADVLRGDELATEVLWTSRVPRMAAVVLTGSAMSVAGLIMQSLTRNRFVAPSTAGTVEAAALGLLLATLWFPGAAIGWTMAVAAAFGLAGTGIFLLLLQRIRFADSIVVPLMGIMLGAVFQGITVFLAYRHDLLQSLVTWMHGDFSGTLRGRYELLYLVGALTLVAYVFADRFTVAGLGRDIAVNLGLDHRRTVVIGLAIAAVVSAVVVVVVGTIPFLGLVVPNLVTLAAGDHLRRVLPATAIGGAVFLLLADIGSRTMRSPYEVPVGTVVGVVGGAVFVVLLLRSRTRAR